MKKSALFGMLIPFLFIVAWWAGYALYNPASNTEAQVNSSVVSVTPIEQSQPTIPPHVSLPVRSQAKTKTVFAYKKWGIDESAEQAKACFEFSQPVLSRDDVTLSDYVRVVPKLPLSITAKSTELCMGGFNFDSLYTITFLKGLPSSNPDLKLTQDVSVDIAFEDRPAYVAFAGEGIILPRINSQGLGVETINVGMLSVEIARVGERMVGRRDPQSGTATQEGEYSWEYNDAAKNIRSIIWTGEIPVKTQKNQKVTTVIPISELTGPLDPGAYIVTVERTHDENERNIARAWRWIISTDLALSSYNGKDGLSVAVRSIDTAQPQSDIELRLVAENNDVLGTQITGADGMARFPAPLLKGKGVSRPKMVMAFGKDKDFTVLDLTRAPLDISENDVTGRSVRHETDVYGFSDRGVYRPGERANLTFLFRDMEGRAASLQPVTLSVLRPNGLEVYSERLSSEAIEDVSSTLIWSYDVPKSAQRGVWTVNVSQDGMGQIGRTQFSVEDFVPAKLRLSVEAETTPMRSDSRRDIVIDSQFLYGAPGAGLEGEAEARIRIDPKPFKQFSEYAFGAKGEVFEERLITLGTGVTDGAGKLPLSLDLKSQRIKTSHPLRAEITVGVSEPGGRYVRDSLFIPIRTQETYLGLKPEFSYRRAPRNKPVEIKVISVNRSGESVSQDVTWTLYSEDWDYQWFREGGRWKYRRDKRDEVIESGTLTIQAGAPAAWSQRLNWGNYRLEVKASDDSQSSYAFAVGWGEASLTDRPDSLQMAGPSEPLSNGDPITLSLNSPYAGLASLVIADENVRFVKNIQVPEGGSEITLPFDESWGQSVYAMLTVYTPRDVVGRPVPRRAVGISYIERDRSQQKLTLDIKTPDVLRPRLEHDFTVSVKNLPRGEKVWMSFAAVDEGILQLTKFKSPDATQYFFGKKAFGLTVRDDYARLLNPNLGTPAIANSGGDSLGGEGLTVVPTKTVSLFEGPVQIKNGKAVITLDIPDFNGELRLMATAWSASAVGSASRPVTVRDKVPAIVGLPRFLAPGDRAFATVSLDNIEGRAGKYSAELTTTGLVTGGGVTDFNLEKGERREDRLELNATQIGLETLKLNVSGVGGYKTVSDFPIEIRSPFRPFTTSKLTLIEAGKSMTLDKTIASEFVENSTDISVSFSAMAGLDARPYVQSLARYPYGCTEQTVSTAMPLLYSERLGGFADQSDFKTRQGMRDAIDRLVARQSSDGAFGLWREGDGYARPWLGVYVTDFLRRAEEAGYYVPETVTKRSLSAMRKIAEMPEYTNVKYDFSYGLRYGDNERAETLKSEAAAYAHYVLVKSGKGDLSGLRYLFDTQSKVIKTPIAQAYLGAALELMGDNRRAKQAFEMGKKLSNQSSKYDYYQSPLRDAAGYIIARADAGLSNDTLSMVDVFLKSMKSPEDLNTHEKAYVILAIEALSKGQDVPEIETMGLAPQEGSNKAQFKLFLKDIEKSPEFINRGDTQTWAMVTISGTPKAPPTARADGFKIAKSVFMKDGTPYTGTPVKQGESLIVKVAFSSDYRKDRTVVLADLLPAGFEIETVLRPEDGSRKSGIKGAYAYLGDISDFSIAEARDDRFVASVQSDAREGYNAAYVMRAVTPGDYIFPGAVLEDMYRPAELALTESSRISIVNSPTF